MALDNTKNFARDSLNEDLTNSETDVTVNDASVLPDPANGNYNIVVWDNGQYPNPANDPGAEIMRVTGLSTNTFAVNRGTEGTSAVAHSNGDAVANLLTAKMINDIDTELGNKFDSAGTALSSSGTTVNLDESYSPTWTGNHDFTGANLDLPTATAPTPTTEGRIEWDTDDNSIKVGNGSGTTTLVTGTAGTDQNLIKWDANGDAIDSGIAASDVVTPSSTDTLTNKTIDADGTGNSVSNIGAGETKLGDGLEGDGSDNIKTEEMYSFTAGHRQLADALSNEELDRVVLQTGETLVIDRIEFRQKGGGSSTSASVRVQDTTAATTIGSQDLGGTTKNPGSSGTANTVQIQVSNSTGSSINASVTVTGRITGA